MRLQTESNCRQQLEHEARSAILTKHCNFMQAKTYQGGNQNLSQSLIRIVQHRISEYTNQAMAYGSPSGILKTNRDKSTVFFTIKHSSSLRHHLQVPNKALPPLFNHRGDTTPGFDRDRPPNGALKTKQML
jgi:hypothetical protein